MVPVVSGTPHSYVISRSSGRTPSMCALTRGMGVAARACCLPHGALRLSAFGRVPLLVLGTQAWGSRVVRHGQRKGGRCTHGGWGVGMARWVVRRSLLSIKQSSLRSNNLLLVNHSPLVGALLWHRDVNNGLRTGIEGQRRSKCSKIRRFY